MKILLVDDTTHLARLVARDLQSENGHDVTLIVDPADASKLNDAYDVAVIDLLFEQISQAFDRRRLARQVSLSRDRLLITGLNIVERLSRQHTPTKVVLWTSGEANRRLHLLYAYEELGIRSFCSKSPGIGTTDVLNHAILSTAAGHSYVDPVLSPYLPSGQEPLLTYTLLRDKKRRAVWRAVALGAHSREEIAETTGYERRTIGNLIPELLDDILLLTPGLWPGKPLNEVVRFANRNWEFFLDDAVRVRFP